MAAILPRQLDRLEEHEFPKGFNPKAVRAFLDETSASGGAELANSQSIIRDLCQVLGVAAPKLKHAGADNPYCFEEDVKEGKAHRRIDVYKRGCFVLEAKQGADPKAEPADALARSAAKATYNVMAKLRMGAALTAEDEKVRAMALADTLLDLHDQLDRAVADTYGWPHGLSDDEVLTRLVTLNAVRAAEEAKGVVRWLRPDFQVPDTAQAALAIDGPKTGGKKPTKKATKATAKLPWPAGLPGRIEALVTFLRAQEAPWTAAALAEEGAGATLADMLLTLQCAAAAQAVTRLEDDEGREVWAARA